MIRILLLRSRTDSSGIRKPKIANMASQEREFAILDRFSLYLCNIIAWHINAILLLGWTGMSADLSRRVR